VTAGYRADLLRAADLVVAVNSNLGLEALLCGRALVNVPLIPAEADALFPADAGVLALGAPAETETAVARVLADAALRARLEAAAPALVRRYVHVPDGRASERVAGVVAECVRAARAAGGRQVVRAPAPGAAPPAATSVPGAGTGLAPAKAGASAERDGVTA
jgi:hypothetical protein